VRQQLGNALAIAIAQQQQLSIALMLNQQQQQQALAGMAAAQTRITQLTADVQSLQSQVDTTKEQIDEERAQLTVLAKALYAQPKSVLVLAAQSHSLDDLLTRTSELMVAAGRARTEKDKLDADLARLDALLAQRESDLRTEQANSQRLQAAMTQLRSLQAQAQQLLAQVMTQIAMLRTQLQAVGGESPDLIATLLAGLDSAQLQALLASTQEVWNEVQAWQQTHPLPVVGNGTFSFVLPVAGAVLTQPFGPSPYAFEPPYGGVPHFHTGVDLAAPKDTPGVAAASGVVAVVGSDPWGYGNYVVIAHGGGMTTLYGHLDLALVQPGQQLDAGALIGLLGSTGNSTGPHVHFELRLNNVPEDPLPFLPPIPTA
jgi:murein DD-endopeptidase MepM/ murein hydrolase activator NlpD